MKNADNPMIEDFPFQLEKEKGNAGTHTHYLEYPIRFLMHKSFTRSLEESC